MRIAGGERTTYDVPFPAGLAVNDEDNVYVSAFSVFDADGPEGAPSDGPHGQVWRIHF